MLDSGVVSGQNDLNKSRYLGHETQELWHTRRKSTAHSVVTFPYVWRN